MIMSPRVGLRQKFTQLTCQLDDHSAHPPWADCVHGVVEAVFLHTQPDVL